MKFYESFFISTLIVFSALAASAQNIKQRKLIAEDSRPAIEEILSDVKYLEAFSVTDGDYGRVSSIQNNIAKMIVSLEKAFPNGIYAFLGRDMDLIADATDAFYRSINQNDRVARVRFSTPSLENTDSEKIGKYLSQIGLDIRRHKHQARPFVIIDYTSYSPDGRGQAANLPSQARFIIQNTIRYLLNNGISPKEVSSRIALATLDENAKNHVELVEPLRGPVARTSGEYIARHRDLNPIVFLDVDSKMAYYSEWHDSYGEMKKNKNGKIETEPSGYFDSETKTTVYKYMVDVVNLMISRQMKSEIFSFASQHKVTFDVKPEVVEEKLKLPAKEIAEIEVNFKKDINSLIKGLKKLPKNHEDDYTKKFKADGMKMKLTPNGSEVIALLTNEDYRQLKHYLEISLEVLIQLYNSDKIGAREFRRIFSYVLTLKKIETKDIFQVVLANYSKVLPLEIMFGRATEREKYSELEGYGGDNYKLILEKGKIRLSCSFLF